MAPPDPTPDIRIISSLIYKGESSDLSPKDYNFFSSYASACGWDLATTKMRLILHIQGNGHPLDWKTKNMAWILDSTTTWEHLIDNFITDLTAAEDFCTVVFDEFLCPGLPQENVTRHLLRLVFNVCNKLGSSRLESVMKTLQPSSMQTESLRIAFGALEEKINAIEASHSNEEQSIKCYL
jgi:hypothetical protein